MLFRSPDRLAEVDDQLESFRQRWSAVRHIFMRAQMLKIDSAIATNVAAVKRALGQMGEALGSAISFVYQVLFKHIFRFCFFFSSLSLFSFFSFFSFSLLFLSFFLSFFLFFLSNNTTARGSLVSISAIVASRGCGSPESVDGDAELCIT